MYCLTYSSIPFTILAFRCAYFCFSLPGHWCGAPASGTLPPNPNFENATPGTGFLRAATAKQLTECANALTAPRIEGFPRSHNCTCMQQNAHCPRDAQHFEAQRDDMISLNILLTFFFP
jgi:hypothetical protein